MINLDENKFMEFEPIKHGGFINEKKFSVDEENESEVKKSSMKSNESSIKKGKESGYYSSNTNSRGNTGNTQTRYTTVTSASDSAFIPDENSIDKKYGGTIRDNKDRRGTWAPQRHPSHHV